MDPFHSTPPPLVAVFESQGVYGRHPGVTSSRATLTSTSDGDQAGTSISLMVPHLSPTEITTSSNDFVDNAGQCMIRLGQLINSAKFSDVTLFVGGRKYHAHRLLLANASDVFEQMLTGQRWIDSGQSELILEEHENCFDVFEDFLRYMYTGQVKLSSSTVLGLLVLADKYNVPDLKDSCSAFMRYNLVSSPEHSKAILWFQYALACSIQPLEQACLHYIILNVDTVIQSADWTCLDKDNLVMILQRSDLVVESEYTLLQAVIRWMLDDSRSDTINENLRDVVPCIRFPMMLPEHLFEFEETSFLRAHHDSFQTYLLAAYRYHALSIKGKRECMSCFGVPALQYSYRNYTDENYSMYVDVIRKSYLACPRVSSKVERPMSIPVSVSNAIQDRQCKMKVTFYPQGYYTTSLWNGQLNLAKSTELTRLVLAHRGGVELLRAAVSVVIYAQQNGVRYIDYAINAEHTFEVYGQLEFENTIDIEKLNTENSKYIIDGAVWVRVFVRPYGFFTSSD